MYYSAARKLLRKAIVMEAVEILLGYVFVGLRSVQHAGREWRSEHCICYRSYLASENRDPLDDIASVYGGSSAL